MGRIKGSRGKLYEMILLNDASTYLHITMTNSIAD